MACFAQKEKADKPAFVIVTGKVLSFADSNLVKRLYFDGLHEKIIQNEDLAAGYFKQVIEIDPANDAAMYELGYIYHLQNKDKEAERLVRDAVTVAPDNIWYWVLLAEVYKKTNNIAQLLPVFDEIIRISPGNEDYYFDKASAFLIQNKANDALAVYNDMEKHFGLSEDLSEARQQVFIKQGKPDKAAAEIEKKIQANPNDLRNYLYLAEIYAKSGNRDKAVAILQKAKVIDPANAMVRLSLADNYRKSDRFPDAFVELKVAFADPDLSIDEEVRIVLSFFPLFADAEGRAYADELASVMVKTHPDDPKAFAIYGDVLFQEQKFSQALENYRKALKLNNQVYQIWEQVLRIDIGENNFNQAIIDGDAALAIFPNQAPLYLYTGIAYAQLYNHEQAVNAFKEVINLETEDKAILEQAYSSLGDSYNALKHYKESDQAYEKVLEINPDNSYTLNNYAYYLTLKNEDLEKAEKMSKHANQLDPNNSSLEDTYAWVLFHLKKYEAARTWIEKAINNDKNKSAVQMEHYGDIIYHLGEKDKAVEQWIKAKAAGAKSKQLDRKINEKKYVE